VNEPFSSLVIYQIFRAFNGHAIYANLYYTQHGWDLNFCQMTKNPDV